MSIYYVSTLGNDSTGNGGPATPWATPQKAASVMVAGDTCNILGGTYNGRIRPTASGTSSTWITFQAYPVGAAVFINGGSAWSNFDCGGNPNDPSPTGNKIPFQYIKYVGLTGNGTTAYGIDFTNANNLMLENCTFQNSQYSGIGNTDQGLVCTNITLNGCKVTKTNSSNAGEMISFIRVNGFVIENCLVFNTAATTNKLGIDCKVGCTNGLIQTTEIYGAGWGIYIDAGGVAESNISIYNMNIHDNTGGAICVTDETGTSSLSNIDIYNNLIYGNFVGINIHQYATTMFNNITVENNTLYNNDQYYQAEITFDMSNTYVANSRIANNIINGTVANVYGVYAPSGIVVTNNNFYNSGGAWASGNVFGTNSIQANPLMNNPANGDFTLQAGSPCIGAASSVGAPTTDYAGNPWTGCIGAYQYQSGNFTHGTTHTASFSITELPAGISCQVQLQIGTSLSSKVSFTSGSNVPVSVPITMPAAGKYSVYIDVYMEGVLIQTGTDPNQITVV
jgi:hypothetical protein